MRQFLLFLGFFMIIASCKKDTYYELRIGITNMTNKDFQVTLFPKPQYIHGDLYKSSTDGGGYSLMEFSLLSNDSKVIYSTTELDYAPNKLLNEVFDSLIINTNIDSALIIRFKPYLVDNYKTNMYNNSTSWTYKMIDTHEKTNFTSNHVVIYDYKFDIKNDSIIK